MAENAVSSPPDGDELRHVEAATSEITVFPVLRSFVGCRARDPDVRASQEVNAAHAVDREGMT